MLAISCYFFRQDGGCLARVGERVSKVPLDLEAANAGSNPEVELRAERDSGSREPETVRRSGCLIYLDEPIH
jgi:hypothetical protein